MRFIRNDKLQQLCLRVIVENLEQFIYNCNIPQRHIDFLLRLHSKEIFIKFIHDRNISEECMLWFLNRYSRKIYLVRISENITKQLLSIGTTVTFLSLKESLASENIINSILCCVPNVNKLDLSLSRCSDKTLLCIQRMCPEVISLNLNYCPAVTNQGMVNLCGSHVRNLNLRGTSVTPTGIHTILKGIPKLERVTFYNIAEIFHQIHEMNLEGNAGEYVCYNLTELIYDELGNSDVFHVLHTWATLCPNITKVAIAFRVKYQELIMCTKFKNLQHLKILCPCDESIYEVLAPFAPGDDRLTTLIIIGAEISTKLLLEGFRNLKILCLQEVTFTDFVENDIKPYKDNLEELVLKGICLTPSAGKAIVMLLSVAKHVTKLHLTCLRVPPQTFDIILNSMENLSVADFSFTPVDKLVAMRFFRLPSLTTLFLDACFNIKTSENFKGIVSQESVSTLAWCVLLDDCYSNDSDDDESFHRLLITPQMDMSHNL